MDEVDGVVGGDGVDGVLWVDGADGLVPFVGPNNNNIKLYYLTSGFFRGKPVKIEI